MDEWLWMCSMPGFYRNDFARLLQFFESPEAIRKSEKKQISLLPFLKDRQKKVLEEWRSHSAEEIRHKLTEKGIKFISCMEKGYPERLRALEDYPYGLFYLGELPGHRERCVAVVGARMCTNYGRSIAVEVAEVLSEHGISIVSGMAYGIDGIAQAACLKAGGRSYAVTGCGADICYPADHRSLCRELAQKGGVITEYPPGTQPVPLHFPMRNRLISGLSECVIVVEAKKKSGSLITADLALDQGKDVLAVPGRMEDPLSEGCNQLISQGAGILTSMEELKSHLGISMENMKKKKKNNITLASSENMVYICLDFRPKSLTEIIRSSGLPAEAVMRILMDLQMRGLVEEISKNYYVLKK